MPDNLTYLQHALNLISEGIHAVDAEGRTVLYNRKMTQLESMEEHEVLGKPFESVFRFSNGQQSTLLTAIRERKATLNVRQTYYNQMGKRITTINNTYPIMENGVIVGAVEIANDVTKMERLLRENLLETGGHGTTYRFEHIIGESESLQKVIRQAMRAARTSSSVLVIGETGSGKELFVQSIHHASSRSRGPFVSQNCAALPESLVEGLLFGTSKGAYTGAVDQPGLFEQAEGGTLFLDEINSLGVPLQAKLLRAIQEKTFRRLGEVKERAMDVRIIAAMNEEPEAAIAAGRLREDLFYRLGVVSLPLPPLRERKEDILPLARFFIEKYNSLFDMNVEGLSMEVERYFLEHSWPGNVRELQHLIEGAMNLMDDERLIEAAHLPLLQMSRRRASPGIAAHAASGTLTEKLRAFEESCIREAVDRHHGNVMRAARELGISRQSLQYRLRKYREDC